MKKFYLYLAAGILFSAVNVNAQKYITKEGVCEIFSQTKLFTIEAVNKKVGSVLNIETGKLVVSTLVRSFKFHEALVEEHFNENYMDSEKFPKAQFDGTIVNIKDVDFKKNGEYKITIKGDLTIHGTTKPLNTTGTITVKDGKISGKTEFEVSLAAYQIKIEEAYKSHIKDDIKLNLAFDYSPM
jgi:hypothetical protein